MFDIKWCHCRICQHTEGQVWLLWHLNLIFTQNFYKSHFCTFIALFTDESYSCVTQECCLNLTAVKPQYSDHIKGKINWSSLWGNLKIKLKIFRKFLSIFNSYQQFFLFNCRLLKHRVSIRFNICPIVDKDSYHLLKYQVSCNFLIWFSNELVMYVLYVKIPLPLLLYLDSGCKIFVQ